MNLAKRYKHLEHSHERVDDMQFWLVNCEQAIAMLKTVPPHNLNLRSWRQDINSSKPPDCGTIACAGGWLPHWPHFKALGVRAVPVSGMPYTYGIEWPEDLARVLFGNINMFSVLYENKRDSHKQAAIRRFQEQLNFLKRKLRDEP